MGEVQDRGRIGEDHVPKRIYVQAEGKPKSEATGTRDTRQENDGSDLHEDIREDHERNDEEEGEPDYEDRSEDAEGTGTKTEKHE